MLRLGCGRVLLITWLAVTQAYEYNAWQKGKEKENSGEAPAWITKVKETNKEKRLEKEKLEKLAGGGKIREKHLERSETMKARDHLPPKKNEEDSMQSGSTEKDSGKSAWKRSKEKAAEGNAPAWYLKQKEVQSEKGKAKYREKKCAEHPGLPFCQPGWEPPAGGDGGNSEEGDNENFDRRLGGESEVREGSTAEPLLVVDHETHSRHATARRLLRARGG